MADRGRGGLSGAGCHQRKSGPPFGDPL